MNAHAYTLGVGLALADVGLRKEAAEVMTADAAARLGEKIGIDWKTAEFTAADLVAGVKVELEHGARDPETDVTGDDLETTAKIAWAHLKEDPKYYVKLDKMEKKANGDESAGKPVDKSQVVSWFKKNPNPPDKDVHSFASEMGYNPHELERVIYQLATDAVREL